MTCEKMSLIIISNEADRDLEDCIGSIDDQAEKPNEVILVLSKNGNGLKDRWPGIQVLIKNANRSEARNIGWRYANGPIVCFWESDSTFSPDWFKEVHRAFHRGADAVIDRRRVYQPKTYIERCWDANFDLRYADYKPFSAWAFRRNVLEDVGGFDPSIVYAEDTDLGTRLLEKGYRILLAGKAIQYHKGEPKSLAGIIRRRYIFGRRKAAGFYKKHPDLYPRGKTAATAMSPLILVGTICIAGLNTGVALLVTGIGILLTGLAIKIQLVENKEKTIRARYIPGIVAARFMGSVSYHLGILRALVPEQL